MNRNSDTIVNIAYLPTCTDTINKKGLSDYKTYPLTKSDKKLVQEAKQAMKYVGKNKIDTINHMCNFLFKVEKSGKTGFIIESLIDQSNIRPINEAEKHIVTLAKVIKKTDCLKHVELTTFILRAKGNKYDYMIAAPMYKYFDVRPLSVKYMKNVLYTFIQMLIHISPNSEDPTDADDVIADLALNQEE